LVATIIAEFDRFLEHGGVRVEAQGPVRLYHYGRRAWRLLWLRSGARIDGIAATRGATVFSETALAADELVTFAKQGVYWLDLGGRTRSEGGSRLTEELALFIGRYGVRLARYYDR